MTNNITGIYRISARKPIHRYDPLTEEEAAHRQLVREVMSRLDYNYAMANMRQGRRRFNDAFVAQGAGGPRPGVFIPASGAMLSSIESTLQGFKSTESDGTVRMRQIDAWLAELGSGRNGGEAGKGSSGRPAAIVNMSEAAQRLNKTAKPGDAGSPMKKEAPRLAGTAVSGSLALKQTHFDARIPGDAKSIIRIIDFYEKSAEELIAATLTGKLSNAEAKLVAIELGKLINSCAYYYGATVEERAMNREKGLRAAEYFAQIYLDDPNKALGFMEDIKVFAQHDEMREKGYEFWEGQAYESYKPHPLSIVWKRWERGGDRPYSQEAVKVFEDHEEAIAETIGKSKTKVKERDVLSTIDQIKGKFRIIEGAAENSEEIITKIKLIGDLDMLWVWYGPDVTV